jgi:hypothetical protein
VVAVRPPAQRRAYDVATMHYGCSIYGLGVLANRPIPTVPRSTIATTDVRVSFGVLPEWLDALEPHQVETTYVTDYAGACGTPALVFSRLHGGKFYRFSYADKTEFVVDDAGSEIWSDWREPLTLEDASTYLLGPVMGFVLLLRGLVCLHASAIVVDGKAIALIGPAGAGKSTTAAAFAARGFNVLAEDVVTLDDHFGDRFGDNGDSFLVRPAYPCIRLWPASAATLYGSSSALPPLTPNWDKRYLDLTRDPVLETTRFESTLRPLAALYLIGKRRDDLRAPFVEPLDRAEGLMSLVANTYATKLMDKHMRAREFDLLSRVLSRVPLRRVTPHSDPARLSNLCDRILSDFNTLDV